MTTPFTLQTVSEQNKHYSELKNYFSAINTMFSIRNILAVDMMTKMPPSGMQQRLMDIASVTKRIYAEVTSPLVTKALEQVEAEVAGNASGLSEWDVANLKEMRRIHTHLYSVPLPLYTAAVRVSNEGKRTHKAFLASGNWNDAVVYLQQVLDLYRKVAEHKKKAFRASSSYEALLQGYASDLKEAQVESMYRNLSGGLTALRQKILERQGKSGELTALPHEIDKGEQARIRQVILEDMGFDFARGSLIMSSVSQYSGGTCDDVRLVVRTSAQQEVYSFFKDALYHGARGLYRQNLPESWKNQPVGQPLDIIVMNAVSLLYELIIGRMPEFFDYLTGVSAKLDKGHLHNTRRMIRVSAKRDRADEISKISHDMIRFRIEKDLVSGKIEAAELPERWSKESLDLLGLEPQTAAEGPLQNPDWFNGRFGFIPTNTLSHAIAVGLFEKLEAEYPDLRKRISGGDLKFIGAWLTEHIFSKGRTVDALRLVEDTLGGLDENILMDHFKARYIDGTR